MLILVNVGLYSDGLFCPAGKNNNAALLLSNGVYEHWLTWQALTNACMMRLINFFLLDHYFSALIHKMT
jgi:hypothetical protein